MYKHPIGKIVAVKNGWSWPAFFFSWIWAFTKKLYVVGILSIILILVFPFSHPTINVILSLLISITLGVIGNETVGGNLLKRGYAPCKSIDAETKEGAISLFLTTNETKATVNDEIPEDKLDTDTFDARTEISNPPHNNTNKTDNTELTVSIDNTLPKCPFCNETYDGDLIGEDCPSCGGTIFQ